MSRSRFIRSPGRRGQGVHRRSFRQQKQQPPVLGTVLIHSLQMSTTASAGHWLIANPQLGSSPALFACTKNPLTIRTCKRYYRGGTLDRRRLWIRHSRLLSKGMVPTPRVRVVHGSLAWQEHLAATCCSFRGAPPSLLVCVLRTSNGSLLPPLCSDPVDFASIRLVGGRSFRLYSVWSV
jgi:hypothetical protein